MQKCDRCCRKVIAGAGLVAAGAKLVDAGAELVDPGAERWLLEQGS